MQFVIKKKHNADICLEYCRITRKMCKRSRGKFWKIDVVFLFFFLHKINSPKICLNANLDKYVNAGKTKKMRKLFKTSLLMTDLRLHSPSI